MKRVNILMAAAIVFAVGSAFTPKLVKKSITVESYKLASAPANCINEESTEPCQLSGAHPCVFTTSGGATTASASGTTTSATTQAFSDLNCQTEVFKP